MNNPAQILCRLPGRKEALQKITRYSIYPVMFYRSTDWSHSLRVFWLTRILSVLARRTFGKVYDVTKAELLALIHDDAEIIMGDPQMGNKINMTRKQLLEIHTHEQKAIEAMSHRYPVWIGGYRYGDLLREAVAVESLEAQIVKFTDKFDAFGEALHEVFGGNPTCTQNVQNEYGTAETPFQYYIPYLGSFAQKFPQLTEFFARNGDDVLLTPPINKDFAAIARRSQPHTADSILCPTGYPQYDLWKNVVWKSENKEERNNLIHQKEFLLVQTEGLSK